MNYKVGNKVLIKDVDWYNKNKDQLGRVKCGSHSYTLEMYSFCGKTLTIQAIGIDFYLMEEDSWGYEFTDEMIEGLAKEETKFNTIEEAKTYWDIIKDAWICPDGYEFRDENGNVINAQKIVLEKKPDDKLKLESTKKVREYWSEYARIFIEIYDDEPNECILTHLYTLESYRQKGYGKQALIQAEEIAKELGCHIAHLKVETDSWMHNWYLRCGYQWYKNADEDYVWLTKNL